MRAVSRSAVQYIGHMPRKVRRSSAAVRCGGTSLYGPLSANTVANEADFWLRNLSLIPTIAEAIQKIAPNQSSAVIVDSGTALKSADHSPKMML